MGYADRQMRNELRRAGVRDVDRRVLMGEPVDRRDMTFVPATSYLPFAGLRDDQIIVRESPNVTTGEAEYEVVSWDGDEPHHLAGPFGTLDEAAEAWVEAVTA